MFGHYNLAFQSYHQAKRDFNADSAWQYYAGALEMAALSAFMLGTSHRKTYDYMEDAIVSYLTVCKYVIQLSFQLLHLIVLLLVDFNNLLHEPLS